MTCAEPVRTLGAIGKLWDRFAARVRAHKGRLPIVAVFEPHPGGHGYHVHFGVDRFVSIELIRQLWGQGFVWVGDPGKMAGRVPPRKMAAYLAKYVGKMALAGEGDDQADELQLGVSGRKWGEHRYRVAQGFTEKPLVRYFDRPDDAYQWLLDDYGTPVTRVELAFGPDGLLEGWWFDFPDEVMHEPGTGRPA